MATDQEMITNRKPPTFGRRPTTLRWLARRRVNIRRKKQQSIRLGGKQRRGRTLVRLWRKIRVKWSELRYKCVLKKLVEYYKSLLKELVEASRSFDSYHQRMLMESSFAVPGLGMSFNSYPCAPVGVPL
ncbi:hypothetical protein RJ641_019797 [Dillenia turbinata]|uniref:Uncharacterized protein n=1 Tax=Dillenia turbinata TaxID=194707 RepID=A0AAN8UFV5_9MAGN